MEEENNQEIIARRKEKFIKFVKKPEVWVVGFLVIALILGVYIRSLPMLNHDLREANGLQKIPSVFSFILPFSEAYGGKPGLWDIATNNWTLGPDLDPWLFTRVAGDIIQQGTIPKIDIMRSVPLGFDNSHETVLLPYMIVWTYYLVNLFGKYNLEFAAALFPVLMFFLTIISFFLFVREVFVKEDKESKIKANVISLISTFFMIVIPIFLSRTVAGIPEKESAAFFFLFLTYFFFLRAWKQEKIKGAIIWGIFAGVATAGMGLISGLYVLIYGPIFIACLAAFILNKFEKNQIAAYSAWWISSAILFSTLPGKVSLYGLVTSLTFAPAFLLLILLYVHILIWETKISKVEFLRKLKLPKNIVSLIATLSVGLIGVLILKPSLILEKISALNEILFKPIVGRWNTTVAENSQPHFKEWVGSFGPYIKNIPVFFWLFFVGSVVLFKNMLKSIKKEDSWILTLLYVFFLSGLTFSRYSDQSILTGENFLSKAFYLISVLFLVAGIIYYYVQYYRKGERGFEKVDYNLLIVLSLFVVAIFSARSAVRLVMVLGPIAPIFVGYLIVELCYHFIKSSESKKIYIGILLVIVILLSLFSFVTFYKEIKNQAYNFVPSYYNQQWQKAMDWVNKETPQNAVFAHWWDYGYWVQSIGKRATVLDGGNAINFWNYWMGRLVLTGDNQKDALDFLYSHNTTHLLIDSSDIGKYSAFSSIGSEGNGEDCSVPSANCDRFSWIGTFLRDEKQTQETKNLTTYIYSGGIALDEDLVINQNGKEVLLPMQKAIVAGIILPAEVEKNQIKQPTVVFFYNNQRYDQKIRYVSINGQEFIDFKEGLESTVYLFPSVINSNGQLKSNPIGAAMYISPRLMRGMLAQIYILNDPLKNFNVFKEVHSEENLIIQSLNNQGMNLPEFVYYQGVQGPIKIWEIEYTGEETVQEKYLDKDSSKYLSWRL